MIYLIKQDPPRPTRYDASCSCDIGCLGVGNDKIRQLARALRFGDHSSLDNGRPNISPTCRATDLLARRFASLPDRWSGVFWDAVSRVGCQSDLASLAGGCSASGAVGASRCPSNTDRDAACILGDDPTSSRDSSHGAHDWYRKSSRSISPDRRLRGLAAEI